MRDPVRRARAKRKEGNLTRGEQMALSAVLHRVEDFDAWQKVYESTTPLQAASGVTAASFHRMAGDPDNVLVLLYFGTVAEGRAFFNNPELLAEMGKAGVKDDPRIEFFD
jgi:hypothetical protein